MLRVPSYKLVLIAFCSDFHFVVEPSCLFPHSAEKLIYMFFSELIHI